MIKDLKLGKKQTVIPPRACHLSKYITSQLPAPPAEVNWANQITNFGVMLNDTLGCCTCSAVGHMLEVWSQNGRSTEIIVPDSAILSAYEAVGGYVPGNESTDNGAVISDVLQYFHKTGVGGYHAHSYAYVNPQDITLVKQAINLFGGLDIGLQLPLSAQSQTGNIWTTPVGGAVGNGAPGSWGGHSVPLVSYNSAGLTCITWGALQTMSWSFLSQYCDEAWAVISTLWTNKKLTSSPAGFDLAQLEADIALV